MPFAEHALFESPSDPTAPIFRYMDLAKFVALLGTRSLYFARADQLGDAFEGSATTASLRVRDEFLKQLAPTAVEEFLTLRRTVPFMTFISCWSASSTESNAMWQTYVGDGNGLAIESSYERLTRALGGKKPVHVGTVKYVDYKIDAVPEHNMFLPFLCFPLHHSPTGTISPWFRRDLADFAFASMQDPVA